MAPPARIAAEVYALQLARNLSKDSRSSVDQARVELYRVCARLQHLLRVARIEDAAYPDEKEVGRRQLADLAHNVERPTKDRSSAQPTGHAPRIDRAQRLVGRCIRRDDAIDSNIPADAHD